MGDFLPSATMLGPWDASSQNWMVDPMLNGFATLRAPTRIYLYTALPTTLHPPPHLRLACALYLA